MQVWSFSFSYKERGYIHSKMPSRGRGGDNTIFKGMRIYCQGCDNTKDEAVAYGRHCSSTWASPSSSLERAYLIIHVCQHRMSRTTRALCNYRQRLRWQGGCIKHLPRCIVHQHTTVETYDIASELVHPQKFRHRKYAQGRAPRGSSTKTARRVTAWRKRT